METPVYKFTLSSKKEIYLREPKMADSESCIRIAGAKAGDNIAHMGLITQKELFKKLLVQIDAKELKMSDKEDLNSLFTFKEWGQCMKALQKVTGDEEGSLGEPEIVVFGGK